jgi:hypothetical protein
MAMPDLIYPENLSVSRTSNKQLLEARRRIEIQTAQQTTVSSFFQKRPSLDDVIQGLDGQLDVLVSGLHASELNAPG